VVGLAAVMAALAVGGVSLSTRANAAMVGQTGDGHHRSRDRTVGQKNTTISTRSPNHLKGTQNSAPTSSGGQNATMNALCRKAPCRIAQKVNMLPQNISAFIVLGPSDYLVVP
jgi:hypothetical protein